MGEFGSDTMILDSMCARGYPAGTAAAGQRSANQVTHSLPVDGLSE
jgi:hypothetical protein